MMGTLKLSRRIIFCNAGKICLYAKSPVAPKNTKESEGLASRDCMWGASCCGAVFIIKKGPGAFVVSSLLLSATWLQNLIEIFRWILYLRGGRVGSRTLFHLPQA